MAIEDRLVLLGTKGGPAIRPGGPMPTSCLLEIGGRRCVVDCGLGVSKGLVEAGVDLKTLDLVFLTHLHSDHVLELGPLLHTAWTTGLATGVQVFGPVGTQTVWDGFLASLRFDIDLRIEDEGRPDLRRLVQIHEYSEGSLPVDGLNVTALRVDHPPVTDCFALRFDSPGWSVTFSSDTAYFPPLADFARGSDVLVHEAMLERGVDRLVARTGNGTRLKAHITRSHTEAADAARIAAAADVKTLVLHHLIPADDPGITEADWLAATAPVFDGTTVVGRDGLSLTPQGARS
ncbi:MBL fold metallo-hydrolase [Roseicyclus mahoneyensis]|uniref:Ribonuclease BN (tRNA processing enzyme) n=1 Tax=Roseicyclus mahoneyensis TaxID=164332 RepID=A0A316GXD9_9RHOB|nr:MBL fold metallo-hydrolase [Roseicyclus mahoneyensis]PWK59753.1 ribonuclease BN (tRNA processing enzyme) [Roseicyclus mahoneyensis]